MSATIPLRLATLAINDRRALLDDVECWEGIPQELLVVPGMPDFGEVERVIM